MFGWIAALVMIFNAVFRSVKTFLPLALPVVRMVAEATRNKTDDEIVAFLEANGVVAGGPMTDEVLHGLLLAVAAKILGKEVWLKAGKVLSNTRLRSIAQLAYDTLKQKGELKPEPGV